MADLTESQRIRNSLTLLEDDAPSDDSGIGTDKNGLKLSNTTDSGYYLVSMLSKGSLAGKFIPYANVHGEDLQAAKVSFERSQGGSLVPGFFGHKNVIGLTVEDDVRDAAYIAQKFSSDLELNLMELFDGNMSVIPKPPGNWQHPPAEEAIERMKKAGERAPRKMKPREPKLDAQTALAKVWGDNKGMYKVTGSDAPALRADIESRNPANNQEFIAAATAALEKFKK